MRTLLLVATLGAAAGAARHVPTEPDCPATIRRVGEMPTLPEPYAMRDWARVTRDYLDFVLDFERRGDHLPIVRWVDDDRTVVTLPSYVGGPPGPEAINFLAAVVSGSLVGLDMRDFRGTDWVALGQQFYCPEEGVYVNHLRAGTGKSFWYDLLPNVLAYQVAALYPNDAQRDQQMRATADAWYQACVALGGNTDPPALPNFEHTGFRLATMEPAESGWTEPEAAAGIAWIEYMAWLKYKDPRFLTAADWCLRALEERPAERSPLYEVLLPYGALVAARMNAETGSCYDVDRLVNDCFEPRGRPQARPGWGVIADRWQGCDVDGLVGSATDGGGYAFAMNTFEWAGALVPIARYDTRYAHDIGKWTLNLANAARLFYPDAHDDQHQSSFRWASDQGVRSAVAYEGIRKWKRGAVVASADFRTTGGHIVQGSFESTHARREVPIDQEVLEENGDCGVPFEHVWQFELPNATQRWLVAAAERIDGGHLGNAFDFSFATEPDGPYAEAFSVTGSGRAHVVRLPEHLRGRLYVKAASRERRAAWGGEDRLIVDALAISYQSDVGPFAQGDNLVTFVDLLDDATSPIVLYRPAAATTDLGLYGSSHVGILGGIVQQTDVPRILRLDLLKTDYFHAPAYPTFLYYNPYREEKTVAVDVGPELTDIYDAASDEVLQREVAGTTRIAIPADSARVVVLAPAGRELRRDQGRTLIGDVVVRYAP